MDLNEIVVFARVAQLGSFTAAAHALDMRKSTVSRKVSKLEETLGARLLHRTTRTLSLTDVGRLYFEHCLRIVGEMEMAERVVGRLQAVPRGTLRVTAPINFDPLGPIVAEFLRRFPEVRLALFCTDRVVNLVDEGFDLALRVGPLADSTLVARRLGSSRRLVVASPSYLRKRGRPNAPQDLAEHDCLLFGAGRPRATWQLQAGTRTVEVGVSGRLAVNDFSVLLDAVVAGLGVALLPEHRCGTALRRKRLERVLHDWCSGESPVYAVYPSVQYLSPMVKVFVEHLQRELPARLR
jgi:DNA-binding transcriptional LysR family regulator